MKRTISVPFRPNLIDFENSYIPPESKSINLLFLLKNPVFKNTHIPL